MSFSFPICKCKGTVFIKIWWQVLFVALYSTAIVAIHKYTHINVTISWSLVPILGVATGMLLVFRTNTSYDRYWEARKLWSSMTTALRNLTRNIWVGVREPDGETSKILVEKISALNMIAAFSYAIRNYLRGEYSYEDEDLKYLLRHVPKFYNADCKCKKKKTDNDAQSSEGGSGCSVLCRKCSNNKKDDRKFTAYEEETPTNIPVELSYLLAAWIKNANGRSLIDPSLLAAINNALNALVDCLGGFERILKTPIPLAYSVHLSHATWIYLLTLPPQLVEAIVWWTPFATSLAAFCLLGVLEIGWEIENPFGREINDLPLDDFCRVTHREIQSIMGRKTTSASTDAWLMSPKNRPLAPDCLKNASELVRLPPDDLRALMKRDPVQIRKYFSNPAFIMDEKPAKSAKTETPSPTDSSQTLVNEEQEESQEDIEKTPVREIEPEDVEVGESESSEKAEEKTAKEEEDSRVSVPKEKVEDDAEEEVEEEEEEEEEAEEEENEEEEEEEEGEEDEDEAGKEKSSKSNAASETGK